MYKHYITLNDNEYITDAFSNAFKQPTESDVCVNENGSRGFQLQLKSSDGDYLYKYIDNKIIEVETPLQTLINKKLQELNNYHYSNEVRTLTINEKFKFSLLSSDRDLIDEQIQVLMRKIETGALTEDNAIYNYRSLIDIPLLQLKSLYIAIQDITAHNYNNVYIVHRQAIEDAKSKDELEQYDFKELYLINQKINIAL